MRSVLALRITLYAQLLLGVIMFAEPGTRGALRDLHLALGTLAAVLAIIALRPLPAVPATTVRQMGRFGPLAPWVVGMLVRLGALAGALGPLMILLHVLLGFFAIGVVEAAAGQQRRAQPDAAPDSSAPVAPPSQSER